MKNNIAEKKTIQLKNHAAFIKCLLINVAGGLEKEEEQ